MEPKTYTEQIADMAKGIKEMMARQFAARRELTPEDSEFLYLNCLMLDSITATAEKLETMSAKLEAIAEKVGC